MWSELKPLLSDIADVVSGISSKLWAALKWIGILLAAVAVRLWNAMVMFFLITSDLVVNHHYALLIILPVLTIGFLVTNKLQKKKSFIHIPWYQDPKVLTFLLVPVIIPALGLFVCGGPVSITQADTKSLLPSLGLGGYLGLPTIIWAALISSVLVVLTGVIALKQREKPPRVVESDERVIAEEKPSRAVKIDVEEEEEEEKTFEDHIESVINAIDNTLADQSSRRKKDIQKD